MKKIHVFMFLAFLSFSASFSEESASFSGEGRLFRFKFSEGDRSRILSRVDEDVFVNGALNHKAVILNRISSEVKEVSGDGSGKTEAVFMTSENATGRNGNVFQWGNEYSSVFIRSPLGFYDISDEYFMPTVRDVPVFPENEVFPGDKWTAEGHEAHDLRLTFKIEEPFKVPFTASYEYLGDEFDSETKKTFSIIEVKYNMYFESPLPSKSQGIDYLNYPKITMGHSEQKLWWDNEKGMIDHYSEDFRIIIETFYGDNITFSGKASAEVQEFERISTEENIQRIKDFVEDSGLRDVEIKENEKGLSISIENIQFEPDSSRLAASEKSKLRKIAEILSQFENDILVTGHCADRGTRKNQQIISEERAVSVAEFLAELNVRSPDRIFTQGKGAGEPVASNLTEEGRARNRRVEIILMDK